jgi:hypothetical protein
MISHAFVYAFLAIALGAMVYVVGTPWWTPRSGEPDREELEIK